MYAQEPSLFGDKEVLASAPAWSTMTFGDGLESFSTSTSPSQVSGYRQTLDLRTGTVTTQGTWTALSGVHGSASAAAGAVHASARRAIRYRNKATSCGEAYPS